MVFSRCLASSSPSLHSSTHNPQNTTCFGTMPVHHAMPFMRRKAPPWRVTTLAPHATPPPPPCDTIQDSSAQRIHSAAHWYFQGPIVQSTISAPWFPMDAEASRGLEEAYAQRGDSEGGTYQAGGVTYRVNFALMTQASMDRIASDRGW